MDKSFETLLRKNRAAMAAARRARIARLTPKYEYDPLPPEPSANRDAAIEHHPIGANASAASVYFWLNLVGVLIILAGILSVIASLVR